MNKTPSDSELLEWISAHPGSVKLRDILRAFNLRGDKRNEVKAALRRLKDSGKLRKARRSFVQGRRLPETVVLEITGFDDEGEPQARLLSGHDDAGIASISILLRNSDPVLEVGEKILAKLEENPETQSCLARLVRKLGPSPQHIMAVFCEDGSRQWLAPVDKGDRRRWGIVRAGKEIAGPGDLVEAELLARRPGLPPAARIIEKVGNISAPKALAKIAMREHGIKDEFPEAAEREAIEAQPISAVGREDLTSLPLITIDPADARDRDDAVHARPDSSAENPGGWILTIAIADVAHYVRPGSALDEEALSRGNSTYFPEYVVPMLPENLSNGLCSLHEGEDRGCLACELTIDENGTPRKHRFFRAIMRSHAALAYEELQEAWDGNPSERTKPLMAEVIEPLREAFQALSRERKLRGPLDLEIPERKIEFGHMGEVKAIRTRPVLAAHQLIEMMMVRANAAAAETLKTAQSPLLLRVHEPPEPEKRRALAETAQGAGLSFAASGPLKTNALNHLLKQAAESEMAETINLAVLRSMNQAYYSTESLGHFGLALPAYAHFTSPIRRYSDLLIHRALIRALEMPSSEQRDGLSEQDVSHLAETAKQISDAERRSMKAERDTVDRYIASYLAEKRGEVMPGRVSGMARFGVFVRLEETGADGIIPVRSLGHEYFHYDSKSQTMMGSETGIEISIGQTVKVRILEASAITGGVELELVQLGEAMFKAETKPPIKRRGARRYFKSNKSRASTRRIKHQRKSGRT